MNRLDSAKIRRTLSLWRWPSSRRRQGGDSPSPAPDRARAAPLAAPGRRITFTGSPAGLEIVIPAQRNLFVILFLGSWLVGWCMGEISAIARLVKGPQAESEEMLLVWLVLWTLGGLFAGYTWLWNLAGKERILLGPSTLCIRRDIFGIGKTRAYPLYRIRNLRPASAPGLPPERTVALKLAGLIGAISFEHEGRTVSFGGGLSREEAELIIARMRQRYVFPDQPPVRTGASVHA
jgi:hypothetical protein